jgi:tripartite motif-containing protein 71
VATPLDARGPIVATFRRALRVGLTSGVIAGLLVVSVAPPASASDPLTFRKMIGRPRLGSPEGVVTDASGDVYVIDPYSISSLSDDQLVKFDADGVFKDVIAGPGDGLCSGVPCGELNDPTAVAIAPSGDIYVTQQGSTLDRVERFDSLGNYVDFWGGQGAGSGQFLNPQGVAVDSTGDVYVADTGNSRIQKFTADGSTRLAVWASTSVAGVAVGSGDTIYSAGGNCVRQYDSSGNPLTWTGPAATCISLTGAAGIAVDPSTGNLWVTTSANVIHRYDSNGNPLTTVGVGGSNDGQFANPQGITITSGGEVYVADANNHRIQRFSTAGTFETSWGKYPGAGVLDQPSGLAVDPSGNTYVTNKTEDTIQKFGPAGGYLLAWGGNGCGTGQLTDPEGLATDASGNVYVADTGCQQIQVFDPSGTELLQFASFGTANGQVDSPAGIAVTASGDIYVSDTGNDRIEKYDSSGNFLLKWGTTGTANNQLRAPQGLAIDGSGNVWVADYSNNAVKEFTSTGTWIQTIGGTAGSADGFFKNPTDLVFDADGTLWVLDKGNNRFQRFASDGSFLSKMGSKGLDIGQFDAPYGIDVNPAGDLLVADTSNNRVQAFYDANGPDTTITGAPPALSSSTDAQFFFQADEPGATFECKLDSGSYSACSSGDTFSGNSEGDHTFTVRATDSLSNVGNPASYPWTIDTTPPTTSMDSTPPSLTTSTSASFSFHSSEPGIFRCSLDGATPATCSSPKSYTALSSTDHTFDVWAVDAAGNQSVSPASFDWTVDTTPPDVTITDNPPSWSLSPDATFKFKSTLDPSATFQCHLDNLSPSACVSPMTYTGLAPGQHTFYVRGIDSLNNTSAWVHKAWTVDTGTHRPDGQIAAGGKYAGNNIYNSTGTKQTKTQSTTAGHTISFQVKVENDGNESDTYSLLGSASSTGFAVTYLIGTTDVTAKVKAGTYQFPLGKGQTKLLTVRVAVSKAKATSKTISVTATSVHDPTKEDVVKAIAKRT